jgi:hypothetical protein
MKRIIRLTESDLTRIVRKVISETSKQNLMEQSAIYNWTDATTKRTLKYKVEKNKYFTSRDEGKTWTELTKPTDIEWVKSNVLKPENIDKTAQKASTPQGQPVKTGQKFVLATAGGNQIFHFGGNWRQPYNQLKASPVNATIQDIKYLTNGVNMTIDVYAGGQSGQISYVVDCANRYNASVTKNFQLNQRYFVSGEDLQKSTTPGSVENFDSDFSRMFSRAGLNTMNRPLFDAALSYFCENGKLRSSFQPSNKSQSQF